MIAIIPLLQSALNFFLNRTAFVGNFGESYTSNYALNMENINDTEPSVSIKLEKLPG
jgi:hypothetical protein